jgi:hypothetical protein
MSAAVTVVSVVIVGKLHQFIIFRLDDFEPKQAIVEFARQFRPFDEQITAHVPHASDYRKVPSLSSTSSPGFSCVGSLQLPNLSVD